jgi:ribosome maturation factor RimP
MYRDIRPDLLQVIDPVVASHGLEIVDIQQSGVPGRGRLHLRVILDTRQGDGRVTIDECARVSREIGHGLDAANTIAHAFVLEVCSPGLDRTLARWVDFERAVGREVQVEIRAPIEGRRRFRGDLVACADQHIEICLPEGLRFRIPFEQVSRAKAFFTEGAKAKR